MHIPPIPLQMLRQGQRGFVHEVAGAGEHTHRLHEMGLRTGAEIEMVRHGSPCIVRIAGHKLCLRSDELQTVLVQLESP